MELSWKIFYLNALSFFLAKTESATDSTSKYSIGASSRQARLNKEASQMRSRVQQLLESVASRQQQQKRGRKASETPTKASSLSTNSMDGSPAGMAALFVRKNPVVATLFPSSSSSTTSTTVAALNARHLRMNRQLTVSFLTSRGGRYYFRSRSVFLF